ncbi:MAG: RNA-binding protein [Candidatus Omnitrophica bacterium]|nr:RNA-binding protein [Candidatus Omnitrophota bacterium]MBU0878101.1 RNA-binding protein [Candidatus Omnitrophota bacterium]MBU0896763.1 RNA-binding protein [Candidatus Omnitrophota bacterium]MBU1134014.1 RNA-binding protein [Candidatus Omnitrophota bacterium]MBU1810820.1 RNA-binding protein [Candidatus Omnitrophota bacterium]
MEEEKKIYIGNLEYGVTEGELKGMLEAEGINALEVKLITDRYTGRPKGFGFAEFETAEAAQKAIELLNGKEVNGRALTVNKAKKMEPRRDNKFGSGGSSGGGSNSGGGGYGRGSRY